MLKRLVSYLVKASKRSLDLWMSTVVKEELLKENENRNLGNPTVDHGVGGLWNEDRDAETAVYSSTKKLLLGYMKAYSGQLRSAK